MAKATEKNEWLTLAEVIEPEPEGFDLDEFIAQSEQLKSQIGQRLGGDVTDSAETIRRNREQRSS